MSKNIKLVSLLSNWYSGATLFTILLNHHSQIVTHGEGFPFNDRDNGNYICSCGKPLIECGFYREAAAHMLSKNDVGWDRRLFVRLPCYSKAKSINSWLKSVRHFYKIRDISISVVPKYRKIQQRYLDAHEKFFLNSLRLAKASIYVDGTKSIRRAELFANNNTYSVKVIHIVRNGMGFYNSYVKNRKLKEYKISDVTSAWLNYIKYVDLYSARNPGIPLLVIRYEDLCRDLTGTMKNVCKFLEIEYEKIAIGKNVNGCHVLGNRMRMAFSGTLTEDISWRTELGKEEIDKATGFMNKELKRFGYL